MTRVIDDDVFRLILDRNDVTAPPGNQIEEPGL
jgi:hypothetical protein